MTRIISSLDAIEPGYTALLCDLWGCLHDGVRALPEAVAALEGFRRRGGRVVLLTNSPRPAVDVARQLELLGASRACYDAIVSSGATSMPRARRRWRASPYIGGCGLPK